MSDRDYAARRRRHALALACVAGTFVWQQPGAAQSRTVTTEQRFERPSVGVGPNPHLLVIENGQEDDVTSLVVIQALQSLQHSLVDGPAAVGATLTPNKEYTVDIVPLTESEIAEHNQEYPNLALPTSAVYGISYKLKYSVRDKPPDRKLLLQLRPVLNHRGTGSKWREYKREYSSEFFGDRVLRRVTAAFAALQPRTK